MNSIFARQEEVIGTTVMIPMRIDVVSTDPEIKMLARELNIAETLFNTVDGSKKENEMLLDSLCFKINDLKKQIEHRQLIIRAERARVTA